MVRPLTSALVVVIALLGSACEREDNIYQPCEDYDRPTWVDLEVVPNTGLPQEKIDRFVAANGMDTTVTESGLIYVISDPGQGERPSASDQVEVQYRGYFVDGRVFDSTDRQCRNAQFGVSEVIPAWTEGLQLLAPGGQMWMVVRPALGYGASGSRSIPANEVIVFEVKLVGVQ